jgi:hypothetical protein
MATDMRVGSLLALVLALMLPTACRKPEKSEAGERPVPTATRSLLASLPPQAGPGPDGYREARWGSNSAAARTALPSRTKIVCGELDPELRARRNQPPSKDGRWHELDNLNVPKPGPNEADFRRAVTALYSAQTDNYYDETDGITTFLATLWHLNQQHLNLDTDPQAKLFSVARIGPGCGLFFQGRYTAQLNIVLEKLSPETVLKSLAESVGPYRKVAEQKSILKNGGGPHEVYGFNGGRTVVLALIGSDRVATLYMDRERLLRLPKELSEAMNQQQSAARAAQKQHREKNSARLKDDL